MVKEKKVELQTFKDLKFEAQLSVGSLFFFSVMFFIISITLLAGMRECTKINGIPECTFSTGKIAGGLVCFGLFIGLGYWSYSILIDPKNEKTCNANFWKTTTCVSFPEIKEDSVIDLGTTICKAQTRAEYDNNINGFYARSNTADTIDVLYFSNDSISSTNGRNILYYKKGVKASGGGICPISPCPSGTARTPGVSPITPCYSPCPSGKVRYGSNSQCETDVSSFGISSVTISSDGEITINTSGPLPRRVYLYVYSDSNKSELVTTILYIPGTNPRITSSMSSGTTYYYKYRINDLNDPIKSIN